MLEKMKFIMSSMWGFFLPALRIFLTAVGPILATAAMEIVTVVADNMVGESDDAKRNAAIQAITLELAAKGIVVAANEINKGIEFAVAKLKAERAAAERAAAE